MQFKFKYLLWMGLCWVGAGQAQEQLATSNQPTNGSPMVVDLEFSSKTSTANAGFGIGFYQVKPSGLGFYGNLQATGKNYEPMYDTLSLRSFGDAVVSRHSTLGIFNFGLTTPIVPHVHVYGGLGLASVQGVARKLDPTYTLADDGYYYVRDKANDKTALNINAGTLITVGKLAVNVGYQSYSKALMVGVGMKF